MKNQPFTVAEFKERIRAICGLPPTGFYVEPEKPDIRNRKQTKQTHEEEKPTTAHTDPVSRAASERV